MYLQPIPEISSHINLCSHLWKNICCLSLDNIFILFNHCALKKNRSRVLAHQLLNSTALTLLHSQGQESCS